MKNNLKLAQYLKTFLVALRPLCKVFIVCVTYLDGVENDCHDVSFAGGLTVFGPLVIASVPELSIIVCPSVLCVAE